MVCEKGFSGKVWEVLYSVSLSLYYIHDAIFYLRLCLYGFDLVYLWLSWAETSSLPLQSCCKVTGTFYLT